MLLMLGVYEHSKCCVYHERFSFRYYAERKSDVDGLLRNLCGLHRYVTHATHGVHGVPDGKSTNGGGDGMHSSDASTSHVPNSYARTTNLDNIPNTMVKSTRTMLYPRTNHRSMVCVYR